MKGTMRWVMSDPKTSEFQYDIAQKDFDTEEQSIRDTLVELLVNDWESFGERGDTIIIDCEEED